MHSKHAAVMEVGHKGEVAVQGDFQAKMHNVSEEDPLTGGLIERRATGD